MPRSAVPAAPRTPPRPNDRQPPQPSPAGMPSPSPPKAGHADPPGDLPGSRLAAAATGRGNRRNEATRGAIVDPEHVQEVLDTLTEFVQRDIVYYKYEEAMLRQVRNAHRLRGKHTAETKQELRATFMKVGLSTVEEKIGVERKRHGRDSRFYWGASSSGPLPNPSVGYRDALAI